MKKERNMYLCRTELDSGIKWIIRDIQVKWEIMHIIKVFQRV
jgi:hypothetical protein